MNSIARGYALALGGTLALVGLLGWIPALTPQGALLGLFALNPLHNLVHLLTGLVGLGAGLLLPDRSVRLYTITMTAVYGLVALVGYVQADALGVLSLNLADTLLHTAIFVLSLMVVLAAAKEQGLVAQRSQLFASLRGGSSRQPRGNASGFTATPSNAPWSAAGRVTATGPMDQRQLPIGAEALTGIQEQLRRVEYETRKIGVLSDRQTALEQQVAQLHHEVEQLRGYLQALSQQSRPTGGIAQSRPTGGFTQSRPTGGFSQPGPSAPFSQPGPGSSPMWPIEGLPPSWPRE